MSIIGITGRIGSGKTTVANFLKERGYKEYTMAGPLKKIGEVFHFSEKELYGTQEEKRQLNPYWNISARHFLQKFGTEICRRALVKVIPEMKNIWVRLFEIELERNPNVNYVVSDVRFVDEALAIRKAGGRIIALVRNTEYKNGEQNHDSEREIERIEPDFVLVNDQSKEILFENVLKIIGSEKKMKKIS